MINNTYKVPESLWLTWCDKAKEIYNEYVMAGVCEVKAASIAGDANKILFNMEAKLGADKKRAEEAQKEPETDGKTD